MSLNYRRRNTDNRSSTTLGAELRKKEMKKAKYKRLKNHTWGLGLEHETHLFHKPIISKNKKIDDFVLFDTKPIIEKLLKDNKISRRDKNFLATIPFEPTGRKCNGKVVLKKTPIPMPEFVTEDPFSSLETGKRPIEYYCEELMDKEFTFKTLMGKVDKLKKLQEKYGEITQYPFGMTSYLKYPIKQTIPYKFDQSNGKDVIKVDYLGSYHLTITLPFTNKTSEAKFIKMHQNFANQMQWLEPLLLAGFFSSDQRAVGTNEKRIKGSYRVARVGWGNLAGSDVRKFNKGIGRYSDIKTYWRDGLEFKNVKKVEYCQKLSPKLKKVEPGAISGYSSNFRTFGSTDPARPWHRESGAPMNKPNGIEMRIYDHFPTEYICDLCKFIIYVAENSRVHEATKYVYQNKGWIDAVQKIMLKGWSAMLLPSYVKDLRIQLGLKIATKSLVAFDILKQVNVELFRKNKKGDWTYLMLEKEYKDPVKLPQINRRSWETGLMLKLNRNKVLLKKFNKLLKEIPNKEIKIDEMKKLFFDIFSKKQWSNDFLGVVYFLETHGVLKLKFNQNGSVKTVKLIKKRRDEMGEIKDFNVEIIQEWDRPRLMEIVSILQERVNQ